LFCVSKIVALQTLSLRRRKHLSAYAQDMLTVWQHSLHGLELIQLTLQYLNSVRVTIWAWLQWSNCWIYFLSLQIIRTLKYLGLKTYFKHIRFCLVVVFFFDLNMAAEVSRVIQMSIQMRANFYLYIQILVIWISLVR